MRRLLSTVIAACALALSAAPVLANGPAVHDAFPVTGDVLVCGVNNYTITSGTVSIVSHEGSSTPGNLNGTFTGTPKKVVAVDEDGNEYSIVGAVWSGFSLNAQTGGFQTTFTGKLQIVSRGGGTVDSVNVVFHISPNGDINAFDFGTCEVPA